MKKQFELQTRAIYVYMFKTTKRIYLPWLVVKCVIAEEIWKISASYHLMINHNHSNNIIWDDLKIMESIKEEY